MQFTEIQPELHLQVAGKAGKMLCLRPTKVLKQNFCKIPGIRIDFEANIPQSL